MGKYLNELKNHLKEIQLGLVIVMFLSLGLCIITTYGIWKAGFLWTPPDEMPETWYRMAVFNYVCTVVFLVHFFLSFVSLRITWKERKEAVRLLEET